MDDERSASAVEIKFDTIGYWSELKLDIIREYAAAYSRILNAQPSLHHSYIDAFAGSGLHISKATGEFVRGSPANAMLVSPSFREYHFIDLDHAKLTGLEALAQTRPNVHVYAGDCNQVLIEDVFPQVRYEDYRRALCVLDPYGLHLDWKVIATAGRMKSVEIFLNFPVADINRNVLWNDRTSVSPLHVKRMDMFWGDDSWAQEAYRKSKQNDMFGSPAEEKASNDEIAEAFRRRLRSVAGFKKVPKPIAMRNSQNAIVYYLYFASQNPTAEHIVQQIFEKYGNRRGE